jgi:2-C-methyl-D-erythritol 4-phosphate cytidylyltransferase
MSAARPPFPAAAGTLFHAVVPAAGRGERFGGEIPKQFLAVAGRPLLSWSVARLFAAGAASVAIALPEEELASALDLFGSDARIRAVAGGSTRQASVVAALEASPAGADELVAVHDGARAAVDPADVRRTVEAARAAAGAVLGRAATDTVKRLDGDRIAATLDRRALFFAETPQVFRRALLERALAAARDDRFVGTDEASLVERLGGVEIAAVEAAQPNPKVTFRSDLEALARLLVGGGRP